MTEEIGIDLAKLESVTTLAIYKRGKDHTLELVRAEQIGYEKGIAEMRDQNEELVKHIEKLVASAEELNEWMDRLWLHTFSSPTPPLNLKQKLARLFTT